MRIAVDAMGGDHAPGAIVEGAIEAAGAVDELMLVGAPDVIEPLLARVDRPSNVQLTPSGPAVPHPPDTIQQLKRSPDASIRVAAELVRRGQADALVSAGPTGAVVAAARMYLRRVRGVKRTAIAVDLPRLNGPLDGASMGGEPPAERSRRQCTLLDTGATVRVRPIHLFQFAVMGAEYAKLRLGLSAGFEPRVGLLNMGSEAGLLPEVRKAHRLLKASALDYAGYVEGEEVFAGDVDVVVCDGFVGNALLKFAEGLAGRIAGWFGAQAQAAADAGFRTTFAQVMARFRQATDFAEIGGAPLLGTRAPCIICHGKSDARAIARAIASAARLADFHTALQRGLEQHRAPRFV